MPAFGENLRREREMRGVSLEEISSYTRISVRFLEVIEQEAFAKLPGGFFARSFIRSYARYLGLDEERAIAEYQLAAQPQTDVDLHRLAANIPTWGRPRVRTRLVASVVGIVLLMGGYVLFRYSQRASEIPAPPPPAVVVTPKPAAPPAQPTPLASGNATALPGVNPATGEVTPGAPTSAPTTPGATSNPRGGPAAGA